MLSVLLKSKSPQSRQSNVVAKFVAPNAKPAFPKTCAETNQGLTPVASPQVVLFLNYMKLESRKCQITST